MSSTDKSLLRRLRESPTQADWERFVKLYTPFLRHWGSRLHMRSDDIPDFVQDILMVMVKKLPEFEYNPGQSFRGWLFTIVRNQWRAYWSPKRRKKSLPTHQEEKAELDGLPDPDWVLEYDEQEYRAYLVTRARQLIETDFKPKTWQSFWETTVVGRPALEVAAELHISVGAVYANKSRVLRRLRRELEGLWD